MQMIQATQINKDFLVNELQNAFPDYRVKKSFGNIGVRKSNFTVTRQVGLMINEKKGIIRTNTALDMVFIYFLFCWPLAIYVFIKKDKIKAMEAEVLEEVDRILLQENKIQEN